MAFNIILADPQVFTPSLDNELYYQGWKADVVSPVLVKHLVGTAGPTPVSIEVEIEDVFKTLPSGIYSKYFLATQILQWKSEPTPQANNGIAVLSGDANPVFPGTELTLANLVQTMITSFGNMNLLSPGKITWNLDLGVHGLRADSAVHDRFLTRLQIPFELEVLAVSEILADTDHLHLPHIIGAAPLAGQQFEVLTGIAFQISLPNYFELSGGNIVEGTPSAFRRLYSGTGRQTLTINLVAAFDLYDGTRFNDYMYLSTNDDRTYGGRLRNSFTVQLSGYQMAAHGFTVDPEALEFFSIKGVSEAAPQQLQVICTEAFTVAAPFWLQVTPTPIGNFEILSVVPISSENLVEGVYEGVITLTSASAEIEVPVQLTVAESIDEAFSSNGLNFTDDNADFSHLYSTNPAERASLVLGVSSYNYKGFASGAEHTFKRTFFQSKASLHIGEIVARRLQKIASLSDTGFRHYSDSEAPELFRIFPYYKPASVNVGFSIEDRSTGDVSKAKDFNGILYVGGRTPKHFSEDYGILNYAAVPVRVTEKSQLLFNFARRFMQHQIKVYRNNAIYKTITHSPGNNSLFGLAIAFRDFTPGDVIDIRLETEGFEQKYLMFPPQKHSNHIVFENEYRVLECYEFTGAFQLKSGYENITATTYAQLVERTENLESRKEQRLLINTGWILKSNQVIIDAIVRSRRAWFVNGSSEISLTPVAKELVNEDSGQELYQYDVEFIINRSNDLEVYTS